MRGMIARLVGTLAEIASDNVVLDVQGVGYEVAISRWTHGRLPVPGATLQLYIHTHVREDQLTLFGFTTPEERALFLRLVSVSGVGPKLALTILSGMPPHELVTVVTDEDTARLTAIPGIGKKTAERLVLELKDRLLKDHASLPVGAVLGGAQQSHGVQTDALAALQNLGYSRGTAQQALQAIRDEIQGQPVGAIIKRALKELAGRPAA